MAPRKDVISCEIVKLLGTLSVNPKTGWKKQVCLAKWNGADTAKIDIRDHAPDDPEKISRGITLTHEEGMELCKALNKYYDFAD